MWQRIIAGQAIQSLLEVAATKVLAGPSNPKSVGSGSNQSLGRAKQSKVCRKWQQPKSWQGQAIQSLSEVAAYEKSVSGMEAYEKSVSGMAAHVCPVEGINGQVPICGRYSRGTKISQQPCELVSVRGIALMLRRA